MSASGAPPPVSERETLVGSLRDLLADALRFARAELELVKAQGTATAKRGGVAAGLLIAGALLATAGALALSGYLQMRKALDEAKQVGTTVKEDLEWLKQLPRRSANGS